MSAGNNGYVQTPYEILGVSPNSPINVIKRARNLLSIKYHPDKNAQPEAKRLEAQEMFKRVDSAYKSILAERNGQRFDFNGDDAMAIFAQEFGGGDDTPEQQERGSRSSNSRDRPQDGEIPIELTSAELKSGVVRVMRGERKIRLRNGGAISSESFEIEIVIPPGLRYGDRIRFVNYGDQTEFHSADVVYAIKEG